MESLDSIKNVMMEREIQALIPHRFPILLIDRITGYEKKRWISGIKTISQNDRISIPKCPFLLCESLAQLSKILESISQEENSSNISYLTHLQIEFYDKVCVGDAILLTAAYKKQSQDMVCYDVQAHVSEKKILSGTLFRRC